MRNEEDFMNLIKELDLINNLMKDDVKQERNDDDVFSEFLKFMFDKSCKQEDTTNRIDRIMNDVAKDILKEDVLHKVVFENDDSCIIKYKNQEEMEKQIIVLSANRICEDKPYKIKRVGKPTINDIIDDMKNHLDLI